MDLPLRWALPWSPEFGSEPSGDGAAHWGRSGLCGPGEKMRCPGGIRAFLASVLDSYVRRVPASQVPSLSQAVWLQGKESLSELNCLFSFLLGSCIDRHLAAS